MRRELAGRVLAPGRRVVARDERNELHAATVVRVLLDDGVMRVHIRLRDAGRISCWPVEDLFVDLPQAQRRQTVMWALGLAPAATG